MTIFYNLISTGEDESHPKEIPSGHDVNAANKSMYLSLHEGNFLVEWLITGKGQLVTFMNRPKYPTLIEMEIIGQQ